MQEKESIMGARCRLKIPSLGITVRHHATSLVMTNSYPRDGFSIRIHNHKESHKIRLVLIVIHCIWFRIMRVRAEHVIKPLITFLYLDVAITVLGF